MRRDPEARTQPERHPTQVAERGPAARVREPSTFVLDPVLVERVLREVGEPDLTNWQPRACHERRKVVNLGSSTPANGPAGRSR